MRHGRFSWVHGLAVGLLLACLGTARAQPMQARDEVDPAARAAFEAGRDAYERGRFGEALQQFDRAYAISSNPILLYNIGRAAEADLQNERAVRAYEAYLQALERAENREFVQARLEKLRQMQGSAPEDATAVPPPPPSSAAAPHVSGRRTGGNGFASQTLPPVRLYGGVTLGVAGSYEFEWDDSYYGTEKGDLDPGIGLQIGAGYVWRYFGIGGELRADFLKPKGSPREKTIDVMVKPRGGYQLRSVPFEFYGAVPVGVSIPVFSDDNPFDLDVGATVGIMAGASYFFTRHLGINYEIGWTLHVFGFTDDDRDSGTLTLQQFRPLNLNVMLAF